MLSKCISFATCGIVLYKLLPGRARSSPRLQVRFAENSALHIAVVVGYHGQRNSYAANVIFDAEAAEQHIHNDINSLSVRV